MAKTRCKWTRNEDRILIKAMETRRTKPNWDRVVKKLKRKGFDRSKQQCRRRWMNQLCPSTNKKKWSTEEISRLFHLYTVYGRRWSLIATKFTGRTDNSVKNNFLASVKIGFRKIAKLKGIKNLFRLLSQVSPRLLMEIIELRLRDTKRKKIFKGIDIILQFCLTKLEDLQKMLSEEMVEMAERYLRILLNFSVHRLKIAHKGVTSFLSRSKANCSLNTSTHSGVSKSIDQAQQRG